MSYPLCDRPSFTPIQNNTQLQFCIFWTEWQLYLNEFSCTPKVALSRLLQRWRSSGGARFNTRQKHRPFWMRDFMVFLSTSIVVLTYHLKVGHDHFPSHPINQWLRGPTRLQLNWFRAHHPQRQNGQKVNLTIHLHRVPIKNGTLLHTPIRLRGTHR